ncbi:hypothetical protein MC378_12725 [Polaribacter sp. MSW13]|uniref:Bacteriocin n=1 Tax=Polaribacter marinus TaxID=2916838 RepID=A0A9X1VSK9_9FLAO|nr:hypothetical protein [Polaribacter marinus]MCI2230035.1 hypothetical protein [Polaribacter marinus]
MKSLELNQMENIYGEGWSWKGCAGGGSGLAIAYAGNAAAVIVGGWWGLAGAAIVGCVIGGVGAGVS